MESLLVDETEVTSPRQEVQEHGQAAAADTPLDGLDAEEDDDADDDDDDEEEEGNEKDGEQGPQDDSQALFSGFLKKKGEQRRVR